MKLTASDADRAYDVWGANCGPGAVAAIMDMTLDEVRPHMGDFETKHYTNPRLMIDILKSIGRTWRKIGVGWPSYGLVRVQWEGPWTEPGVPIRARYRFTHWIGAWKTTDRGLGIFDINCINNGSGWTPFDAWNAIMVPHLIAQYPRANGKWHITHAIEVEPPSGRPNAPSPRREAEPEPATVQALPSLSCPRK